MQKFLFLEGLNKDDNKRLVKSTQYRDALNIRITDNQQGEKLSIVNIKGNTRIETNLPTGIYTEIGSLDDKVGKRVFYFLCSEFKITAPDVIMQFNYETNTVSVVYGGNALLGRPDLNFSRENLIFQPSLVDNRWLYFSDNKNEMRLLDLTTNQLFDVAKDVPRGIIQCSYATDLEQKINNLRGRSWQFAVIYVYKDGGRSCLSHYSNVPLRTSESVLYFDQTLLPVEQDNKIIVTFPSINLGNAGEVDKIELCVRSKTLDQSPSQFFVTKTFESRELTSDITSHEFFNNEFERFVDNNEITQVGNFFPRTIKDVAFGYGNRLYLSNIKEKFNIPDEPNMSFDFVYRPLPKSEPIAFSAQISAPQAAAITISGTNSNTQTPQGFSRYMRRTNAQSFSEQFLSFIIGDNVNSVTTALFAPYPYSNPLEKPSQIGVSIEKNFIAPPIVNPLPSTIPSNFSPPNPDAGGAGIQIIERPDGKLHYLQAKKTAFYRDIILTGSIVVGNSIEIDFTFLTKEEQLYSIIQGSRTATPKLRITSTSNSLEDFAEQIKNEINSLSLGNVKGFYSFVYGGTNIRLVYGMHPVINPDNLYFTVESVGIVATPINTFDQTGQFPPQFTFKENRRHEFAIAYSDVKGRMSSTVADNLSGSPAARNTVGQGREAGRGATGVQLRIGHQAPDWATQYHILHRSNKSTFIEIPAYLEWNGDVCSINLNMLYEFGRKYTASILQYSYERGDKIRLISTGTLTLISNAPEIEITLADKDNSGAVTGLEARYPKGLAGMNNINPDGVYIVQISKASSGEMTQPFNETGHVFPCVSGRHLVTDNYGTSQSSSNPSAIININDFGDCYFRPRIARDLEETVGGASFNANFFVEDASASDFYVDQSSGAGRPNVVDDNFKERQVDTAIVFTEPYVIGSSVNGLSTVYSSSIEVYGNQFGSIQRIIPKGRKLDVYMQRRVGAVGLQVENVLNTAGGVEYRTDKILSQMEFYSAEYGIGNHPESFSDYSNADYFVDDFRGVVCRKAENGIIPISEYRCSALFQDLLKRDDIYSIKTTFDRLYNELIFIANYDKVYRDITNAQVIGENDGFKLIRFITSDFEGVAGDRVDIYIINPNPFNPSESVYAKGVVTTVAPIGINKNVTIRIPSSATTNTGFVVQVLRVKNRKTYSFSEPLNAWVSELSYQPNWIEERNIGIVTFENGTPYSHDTKETRNNFYDEQFTSKVKIIVNENPSFPKRFKSIQQESNKKWTVKMTTNTPSGGNRTLFQETVLTKSNLKHVSNMFVSGFWKDVNTVNVDNPLFQGNDMRGQFAEIELENDDTTPVELFSVGVNYITTDVSNSE